MKMVTIRVGDKTIRVAEALAKSESFDALRSKVSAALQDKFSVTKSGQSYPCSPWIRDLFADKVVYELDGSLYQVSYSQLDGNISFGEPIAVEVAYQPLGESHRVMAGEADTLTLREAAYDAATGKLTVTVIKPGMNKAKTRFYPAAMLKRDHKVFEGAKMFANHQTDAEARQRPEGDVNAWVAQLGKTWCESDGRVRGEAVVIDPTFKQKLKNLAENSLLGEMGISIRAVGEASEAEVDGTKCNMIERFVASRSVDFVTYAGAGGQVETLESDRRNDDHDVDLVSEAQLRSRRPDLVTLIESTIREEQVKTEKEQLQEAQQQALAEKARADKAEAKIAESDAAQKKTAAAAELTRLLTEAKLPKPAEERIRKQFAEADKADGFKEAIVAEQEYIKAINPASVRNMGKTTDAEESNRGSEETKKNLIESFKGMGLNDEQAKIAAEAR